MNSAEKTRFAVRLLTVPWIQIWAFAGTVMLLCGGVKWGLICIGLWLLLTIGLALFRFREFVSLAKKDVRDEEEFQHTSELRSLRRSLRQDPDRRTAQLLRDIRHAYDRLRANNLNVHEVGDSATITELKQQAQSLYASCYDLLQRTHALWRGSQQVKSSDKTEALLASRDQLLSEAIESVDSLENALDFLQTNRLMAQDAEQIERARDELEHGLEVAKNVQSRLRELDKELPINAL